MTIPGSANPLLLKAPAGGGGGEYTIERSVRFNSADSAYLSRTPSTAGNRKTWTWAGWVKLGSAGAANFVLFNAQNGISTGFSNNFWIYQASNQLYIGDGISDFLVSNNKFRDSSAWYHVVLSVDTTQSTASSKMKLYVNGAEITYAIDNRSSISTNSDTAINSTFAHYISRAGLVYSGLGYFDGYFADLFLIDGQALDPTSFGEFDNNGIWQPIAYTGSFGTNGFHLPFDDNSTAAALGTDTSGNGNTWTVNNIVASAVDYAQLSNWSTGNSVVQNPQNAFDGSTATQATCNYTGVPANDWLQWSYSITASTSLRFYVPGGPISQIISINGLTGVNPGGNSRWLNLSEVYPGGSPTFPFSFTSIRVTPANSSRNGRLSAVEVDGVVLVSGLPSDIDSLVDVPTNGTETDTGVGGEVRGNYATLNPLKLGSSLSLANGNLDVSASGSSILSQAFSTIAVNSGLWYFEVTVTTNNQGNANIGVATPLAPQNTYSGQDANSWGFAPFTDTYYTYVNGSFSAISSSGLSKTGTFGFAIDATNGKFWATDQNGAWLSSGDPATGTNPLFSSITTTYGLLASIGHYSNGSQTTAQSANFGQRPFAYTAPSGFKALCTANLPAPVVTKPSEYMDVALYTGNGSTQTISGLDFSPDLVWIKNRAAADSHKLTDTVRGATEELESDTTAAEATNADGLTAFNSDGFDLGADAEYNTNTETYVAWTWDAGSSNSTNTDGSITSSVRANTSAGFSIVTWTAASNTPNRIGHGLGAAPHLIIVKSRTTAANWRVYTTTTGINAYMGLDETRASTTYSGYWGSTNPNSTTFGIWPSAGSANNYGDMVAYCFAPVDGYSSFGSYTGNGSADGTFVFTNHRPRWILLKRTDTTSNWTIIDTAREGYNVDNDPLYPNLTDGEGTTDLVDILSNGFKLRSADASVNANAGTYIYASFAEQPFQYSRAR